MAETEKRQGSEGKAHMAKTPADKAPARNRRGVKPLVAALVVLLAIGLGGTAFLVNQYLAGQRQAQIEEQTPVPENPTDAEDSEVPEEDPRPANPIDFPSLKAEHPDIYAWVTIPDTGVNHPIVQSATDDNYYLYHDLDGNYTIYGSVFTQSMNATDFSDPVTVVYGHHTDNGTMFSDLRNFTDKDYFDAHEEMYIYTPGHILTYRIISAYEYDSRHIMNSFDFSDPQVRQDYFASVLSPTSMQVNVREGATLSADDKIVQLSTCVEGNSASRYIVTGVLVSDQETR